MDEKTRISPEENIFISWNHNDRDKKDAMCEFLSNNGLKVWESDGKCTGDINEACISAVKSCEVTIILLTDHSIQSEWVKKEVEAAKECGKSIIPIWYRDSSTFDEWTGEIKKVIDSNSVIFLKDLTEEKQEEILQKVRELLLRPLVDGYTQSLSSDIAPSLRPDYLNLENIVKESDKKIPYISRVLFQKNNLGESNELSQHEFLEHVKDPKSQEIIITGKGGTGKSTLVIDLTAEYTKEEKDGLSFCITANDLIEANGHILECLFRKIFKNDMTFTSAVMPRILTDRKSKILVIFDAADEYPDKIKNVLRNEIIDFKNTYSAKIIITSRNHSDAQSLLPDAEIYELKSFTENDIKDYSKNLFICFGKENECESFWAKIETIVDEIKGNPFFLSMLSLIYLDGNELPKSTVEILDQVSKIYFVARENEKTADSSLNETVKKDMPDILAQYAYELSNIKFCGKNFDSENALRAIFEKRYPDVDPENLAGETLKYLRKRSIIVKDDFAHKIFLDYFSAVYLYKLYGSPSKSNERDEFFKDHYSVPQWQPIIEMLLQRVPLKAYSEDDETIESWYQSAFQNCNGNYDLMFHILPMQRYNDIIKQMIVDDILKRTADKDYEPYAQLFYYISQNGCESELLASAKNLWDNLNDSKRMILLTLVRDFFCIMRQCKTLQDAAKEATDCITGVQEFLCNQKMSPRIALACMFYNAEHPRLADFVKTQNESKVYPCWFNVYAADISKKDTERSKWEGFGEYALTEKFNDELGLYHETNKNDREYFGLVSFRNEENTLKKELIPEKASHVNAVIILPYKEDDMFHSFPNRASVELLVFPYTIKKLEGGSLAYFGRSSRNGLRLCFEYGIKGINSQVRAASLKSIFLPKSITEIKNYSFIECGSLESINIPVSVISIGDYAFPRGSSLSEVRIPDQYENDLTRIGLPYKITQFVPSKTAFHSFEDEFKVELNKKESDIPEDVNEHSYTYEDAKKALKQSSKIIIPYGFTSIGSFAFSKAFSTSELEEIYIPNSISSIEMSAFVDSKLKKIDIPNSVSSIEQSAFFECVKLNEINISENVKTIEFETFSECFSLPKIEIPSSVVTIESCAFQNCRKLKNVSLKEGLQIIEDDVFSGCTSLEKIKIPKTVTYLGSGAFADCPLKEVILSNYLYDMEKDQGYRVFGKPKSVSPCPDDDDCVILHFD